MLVPPKVFSRLLLPRIFPNFDITCFFCKILFSLYFYNDTFLNFISWFYGLFLLVHCIFTLANLRSQYCLWFSAGIFLSILSCLFTQFQLVLCANVPCKSPLFYLIFLYPAQISEVVCDLFFWMCHSKYKFNRVFSAFLLYKSFQWKEPYQPMAEADFVLNLSYKKNGKTHAWKVWQSKKCYDSQQLSHFFVLVWFGLVF